MFEQGLPKRFSQPKNWLWGQFENARGHKLRFGKLSAHKTPLAHIVYIEGLSEFAEKKFELARYFNKKACNFSVIDRFGQGKSDRYLEQTHKQHSEGVHHDIDDIVQYCKENIPEGEPIVLLGHSTGGLIALLALDQEPELFKGAILISPLFGIKNPLANNKESILASLPIPQFLLEKYIPGGTDWRARNAKMSPMKNSAFTSDKVRGAINDYWTIKDEELQTGSPAVGWAVEMCKAIIKARDPELLGRIKQPVLFFTGGRDKLVNNEPSFEIAKQMINSSIKHYKSGKHEMLMETDDIRDDLLDKTLNFLKNEL